MALTTFSTLVDVLRWQALQQPEQLVYTFLTLEGKKQHLSYGELDCQARAIATLLQESVPRGERALLLYPPGLEFISAFFGCLYAGIIAIPLYPPHLNRPTPRLQAIVNNAQAKVVLTTSQVLSNGVRLFTYHPELKALQWFVTDNLISGLENNWHMPAIAGDTLAFLQYTSGSTSAPKGVMVSHKNILHNQQLIQTAFGTTEKFISVGWLPLFHDMGLIGNMLQPLYLGAQCILMPPIAFLQNPFYWLQVISDYKATSSGGPNFAYDLCVRKITPQQRATLDLRSWEVAFNGAEPIRVETLERFARTFAECGFRPEAFYPCYGMAETTLIVSAKQKTTSLRLRSLQKTALEQNRLVPATTGDSTAQRLVGCGQPLEDMQVAIANPQTMTRCFPDEVGEIWVSGASVASGYWNQPEATQCAFGAYFQDTGEGPFLRTGDLGFLDAGELFITGRLKDIIIIRGRNHYPQDIELSVEQSHEALQPNGCAAFAIDIQGEERLAVVVELQRSYWRKIDVEEVFKAIRQAVAEKHELQVYGIMLLKPGSIAKTSSGKIQRYACRRGFLDDSLEAVSKSVLQESDVIETRNDLNCSAVLAAAPQDRLPLLEFYLIQKVVQVLKIPTLQLNPQQPLMSVGLDSLMAVELKNIIETDLGIVLPVTSFLQGDSIADLANKVLSLLTAPSAVQHTVPQIVPNSISKFNIRQPLSYGQRSLWFLHQSTPEGSVCNISSTAYLQSTVDIPALHQAFQKLMERHPCLRTTFIQDGEEPLQQVHESVEITFQQEDATNWSESEFKKRLNTEALRPFNLERGPLLRVYLWRRSSREYVLLLVVHHLVVDFWSLVILVQELKQLYQAQKQGTAISLSPLALSYTDYCHWQAQMLASHEKQLWAYWQQQLAGELPVLNLPTDRPRPAIRTYAGASVALKLGVNLTQKLKQLGCAHQTTLYMTLLAAYQVLLYRYTGQEDILVGSPTAGRNRPELAGLVGYFVNPIVLRANLNGNLKFVDFLSQVRQTVLDAFEHQDYPFALLVEQLQPTRDPSYSQLFQTLFVLQKAHLLHEQGLTAFALGETGARLHLGDLQMESFALEHRVAQFDLTLMMAETEENLIASFIYNTDLFDVATIQRMAEHFQLLLESVVNTPQMQISQLPLLSQQERQQLLVEWNQTAVDYPQDKCIHQLFEQQVERTPDAIAVVYEDRQLTYHELNCRANQLAHCLRARGVGVEVLVGICLERSVEMVVGLLGVLKAGGAYVPLNPNYPQERLSYVLNDSQVKVLLTQKQIVEKLPPTQVDVIALDTDCPVICQQSDENLPCEIEPFNLAYVIYTSGSTGQPKGVMVEHRSVLNLLQALDQNVYADYQGIQLRVSMNGSLAFDTSVKQIVQLLRGHTLEIIPDEVRFDGAALQAYLQNHPVDVFDCTPSQLEILRTSGWFEGKHMPQMVLVGGEVIGATTWKFLTQVQGTRFFNLYGPTECTVDSTVCEIRTTASPMLGRPLANVNLYILDWQLQLVPIGVPGELFIGGESLARGYFNRPELTTEQFIPNLYSTEPGARLYRTGDLVRYRPDGNIEFLGRIDHQVKIRGYRIELNEIQVVLNQHSDVQESVVIDKEDMFGNKFLVAYIVPEKEYVSLSEKLTRHLRHYLKEHLPEYMLPSRFIILNALPLNPNGKLDRRALPTPEDFDSDLGVAYVAPRNEIEKTIATIWQEVLQLEKVGINDNFFDLGGHSLLALQVQNKLQQVFQNVSITDLFEYQNISSLANYLIQTQRQERSFQGIRDRAAKQRTGIGVAMELG